MLRNHYGLAWRRFVAFLFLLLLLSPAAIGAPLVGLPPIKPVIPGGAPITYALSGYVWDDSSDVGSRPTGAVGLPGVSMTLYQISSSGTQTINGATNSVGYYYFGSLVPGDTYDLVENQPSNFTNTTDTLGTFMNSGGSAVSPAGSSLGSLGSDGFNGIVFSNAGYSYSGENFNFGESPLPFTVVGLPKPITIPGGSKPGASASFSTALAVVGTNDRFLAGPGAGSLSITGTILNTGGSGSNPLNWDLSTASTGVSISPTAGNNLAAGSAQTFTGSVNGLNLSNGTQDASVTLAGRIGNGQLATNTATVLIDPVYSRSIDSVTTANLGRIMAGASTSANVTITSAGAYTNYSNLTLNSGTVTAPADANGNVFGVSNSAAVTYNGTTINNGNGTAFTATFSSSGSGPVNGTASIPGNTGLFTGDQTLASGTSTVPSTLAVPYTATVLQQRQLTAGSTVTLPSALGGLLYGADVPTTYSVLSSTDSNHTTSVYVSGSAALNYSADGVNPYPNPNPPPTYYPVGQVTVNQQTIVNSAGTTTVPVSVQVGGAGALGGLGSYLGIASVNVTTAEAASVKDTNPYPSINMVFNAANVGYAATGGTIVNPTDPSNPLQAFGAQLSAPVATGARLATFAVDSNNNFTGTELTSLVEYSGSSGTASTYANSPVANTILAITGSGGTINSSNVYGTVGSECDILASTPLSSSATVSMAWRNRNNYENGATGVHQSIFPQGIWNLSSDVVDIEGVPTGAAYAMEMSFDDGINTFLDGNRTTTLTGAYVAKLVTSGTASMWENAALTVSAGSLAQTAVADNLTNFLATEYATYESAPYNLTQDQILASLVGSWARRSAPADRVIRG